MPALNRVSSSFPSARLPSASGGLPVEVSLIAQLGHGAGDHLFESVAQRQRAHGSFIDALEEPSARLAATDLDRGDATALYSFSVGAGGHPFHRHAGHRIFTAISGSGGAQLRFSTATPAQIDADPQAFVQALRFIDIPPDCLFTVRFGGETWHQFAPLHAGGAHPAFFALSCHTNELGGALSPAQRQAVLDGEANIPVLTDVLPDAVQALLHAPTFDAARVPTIALALDAPDASLQGAMCRVARSQSGMLRGAWSRRRRAAGFVSVRDARLVVVPHRVAPATSLLRRQFDDQHDHEDHFALVLDDAALAARPMAQVLEAMLDGFLDNPPRGVSRLMALRNVLVKPLGLRTSPLGCPVSSLLSPNAPGLFAGRFPVLGQSVDEDAAQVVLGADDKHLAFRSVAGVRRLDASRVEFSLGTRVRYRNAFGRIYMGLIDRVHRRYIAPTMLQLAVHQVLQQPAHAQPATDRPAPIALATLAS